VRSLAAEGKQHDPMQRFLALVLAALAVSCAGLPDAPASDRAGAWGYVRIVPREGVDPHPSTASAYGDRRLRDVRLVDYSRPGFAVVYLEGPPPEARTVELVIRRGPLRLRVVPDRAAVGVGSRIVVRNEAEEAHVVSHPEGGRVAELAPGETFEFPAALPSAQSLFVLDAPEARATLFVAPGPYAEAAADGRFELRDLAPGRHRLLAWHPRMPPAYRWIQLEPGRIARIDLELGVGHLDEMPDATD
jgi:hypothetical protein